MKVELEREGVEFDVKFVTVKLEGKEFKISIDNQNNLVVNKVYGSDEDGCIHITPNVSNEIRIN